MRLGKYNTSRCRPILVTLSRSCEVSSILALRKNLSGLPGIAIKPVMTYKERSIEAILLKKRWELSATGIDKSSIKLRGKSLYVNNGSVIDSDYVPLNSASDTTESEPTGGNTSPLGIDLNSSNTASVF